MDSCRETAFCLTLWYAVLTVIVALLVIALNDLDRSASVLVAANVALLFALALIVGARRLTDLNIVRGQFWHALPSRERPHGQAGARIARRALHETWLEFAKGAAAVAVVLSSLAFVSSGADQGRSADRRGIAQAPSQLDTTPTYRVVRLLPMN